MAIDTEIPKNARVFIAIHPKTFWLKLCKGLELPDQD